jgi:hypothetical protein
VIVRDTVESIAAAQTADGLIPRTAGGVADPWTHVEAAMALAVGGRIDAARRAFDWLARSQRGDGAWYQYYRADGTVVSSLLDANFCAYVATGAWHHFLVTGDGRHLLRLWPVVERAIGFALDLQGPGGELRWARNADGSAATEALLTGSACTWLSLRCACAMAEELGEERPAWGRAAAALADAIVHRPAAFVRKDRWAMDWYYPVLAGVLGGEAAADRLDSGWSTFVMEGRGVRCLSDRAWVTSAETCEAVLACLTAGRTADAGELFDWVQHLRAPDGSYYTGMVHPDGTHFPWGERSTYSSAAAVLAADALDGRGPASNLFAGAAIVHE